MPYHLILGYIFLSLALSIMLYLQYSRNKENKTTSVLKKRNNVKFIRLNIFFNSFNKFYNILYKYEIRLFSFHIR